MKQQMLSPTHDCREYTVYHVAGEYYCEHKDHNSDFDDGVYFFTILGYTPEAIANYFYEDWNKPDAPEYEFDKDMKEFFDECLRKYQAQYLYDKCINEKIEFPEGVAP